jgi:hypothetical protein
VPNGHQRQRLLVPPGAKPGGPQPEPLPVLLRTPAIDPRQLDNVRLRAEIEAVRGRVSAGGLMATEREYLRSLEEERLRRIGLGQVWLAQPNRAPGPLYQLVPAGDRIAVVELDSAPAATLGGSVVMTREQLDEQLLKLGVTRADEAALAGVRGSRIYVPAFESRLPGLFAQPVTNPRHLRSGFTGDLGELSARMGSTRGLFVTDLNVVPWGAPAQTGNFPIFDLRSWFALRQVKASTQARQTGRLGYYEGGFEDVSGTGTARRQALLATAAQTLFPGLPAADAEQLVRTRALLQVNADDVRDFRARITTSVQQRPADYRTFLDSMLRDSPEALGPRRFTSLAQIESAHAAGTLTPQDRAQLLDRLAARASKRVVSHGLTTQELINLQNARARFGFGAASAAPGVIATQVSPEYLMAERAGGGWPGSFEAAGRSARGGEAAGGLVAMGMDIGGAIWDPDAHPELPWELVRHGGLGYASGATGAYVESLWLSQASRSAIGAGVSGRAAVASRGAGGGGLGGAVAAPIFTWGEMLLSDVDYSAEDYFAKGTRATAGGAGSGLLAAGLTGAVWGSEVPIAGNIVGFIVGVGVYMLVDSAIGEHVEGVARGLWEAVGSALAPIDFEAIEEELERRKAGGQ